MANNPRPFGKVPSSAPRRHSNKQCLSFPVDMLKEIEREAARLDRSVSWTVQRAWILARDVLKKAGRT